MGREAVACAEVLAGEGHRLGGMQVELLHGCPLTYADTYERDLLEVREASPQAACSLP